MGEDMEVCFSLNDAKTYFDRFSISGCGSTWCDQHRRGGCRQSPVGESRQQLESPDTEKRLNIADDLGD